MPGSTCSACTRWPPRRPHGGWSGPGRRRVPSGSRVYPDFAGDLSGGGRRSAPARMKVTGHLCSISFTEAGDLGIDNIEHGLRTNSDYDRSKEPGRCPATRSETLGNLDMSAVGPGSRPLPWPRPAFSRRCRRALAVRRGVGGIRAARARARIAESRAAVTIVPASEIRRMMRSVLMLLLVAGLPAADHIRPPE